ncbi:hypothetical protein [Pseudonocardia sp. T1-2H]|uniref:hypothetical protein n=1 Tax=Pseudonocardia sp. T1-2H TaxID=3128899 RepID=UPI003100C34B
MFTALLRAFCAYFGLTAPDPASAQAEQFDPAGHPTMLIPTQRRLVPPPSDVELTAAIPTQQAALPAHRERPGAIRYPLGLPTGQPGGHRAQGSGRHRADAPAARAAR